MFCFLFHEVFSIWKNRRLGTNKENSIFKNVFISNEINNYIMCTKLIMRLTSRFPLPVVFVGFVLFFTLVVVWLRRMAQDNMVYTRHQSESLLNLNYKEINEVRIRSRVNRTTEAEGVTVCISQYPCHSECNHMVT